ncbi:MAG: ABC transporter permease subunit [Myxococcales bacterium]|nr:ABC transporter permease subunit [Myxococcales bacterium]
MRRLRKNRLAMAGFVVVSLMAVIGYSAPLISRYVTQFSLDEQHTNLAFAEPGSRDISLDYPSYDGDSRWFDFVDLDRSGQIECTLVPLDTFVVPSLLPLRAFSTFGNRSYPTLYEFSLEIVRQDTRRLAVPIEEIVAAQLGEYECPEIDQLTSAFRFFDFLFSTYDLVPGDAPVTVDSRLQKRPDDFVSYYEYPQTDAELEPRFQRLGLAGPTVFRALDHNGDGYLTRDEVIEGTRYLRLDKDDLLHRFDHNGDLIIDRNEFPGAPVLNSFWLGTDGKGRDLLTRMVYGARISITIGILATLVSFFIGVTYGSIAGYFGGRIDNIMMRVVDILYGLPFMFVVILLIVFVGRSTINLFIALGAVQWLTMSRVVRGQVVSLRHREFVEAAEAMGVRRFVIIFRHLLRNTVGPVIVYSTLMVPAVIKEEAFLSFLGLGVQPPDPSWGNLISEGAQKITDYYWLIVYPGTALALTLFCMNFLGDGLRDALDPQTSKE